MPGHAYDRYTGEYLCPCPNGTNTYFSRETGQIYCVDCPSGTDTTTRQVFNSYDGQRYCICP